MGRITRPQMFMGMLEVAAMRSTCFRGNVAAFVTKNNDIVAMGYNGPASGEPHCLGNSCPVSEHTKGCIRSIHAEKNAIVRARAKLRHNLEGCDMYCTYSPCIDCAHIILNASVSNFFYRYSYRLRDGLDYLLKSSEAMGIFRVTPAGYVISERSGKFVDGDQILA